ncbi:hypothetical protein Tco_0775685 [Tanacetum coccineum]
MTKRHFKEAETTRMERVIGSDLDAETLIILSENVRNHRRTRTKRLSSEVLGVIAVRKMMKMLKMKRVSWLKHLVRLSQIPTTSRSPRINLSSDKNIAQELTDIERFAGWGRQGYMIRDMEHKCVTTDKFLKVHGKVDQVLYEIVPQLAERATNDLIESNLKPIVTDTIIQERDAFQSVTNIIEVHPTTTTSTETTSLADLQQQLYLKMKSNLQDQANDPALWDALKHKFEKSFTSNTSCRDDEFHSQRHDDHQEDDAPPEGEKRVKRHKTSKSSKSVMGSSLKRSTKYSTTYISKQQQQQQERDAWEEEIVIDEDEVFPEDETPELITKFQNVDKHVSTLFDRARMEATLMIY